MIEATNTLDVDVADTLADEDIVPGVYRHYQGGLYRVHGIAYEETTLMPIVVYESFLQSETIPHHSLWTRPLREFSEVIRLATGEGTRRFIKEDAYDRWLV
jgi:hypothetical protein